jgi:succinate-acetate transporter protein
MQETRKQNIDTLILKDTTANPAPLGLHGFGLTTVLLNIHNAGYFELNSMILAMRIFYGGIAQIIAGIWNGRRTTPSGPPPSHLTAYSGSHWSFFCFCLQFGLAQATSKPAFAAYFFMWGLFTFICSLKNKKMDC